MSKKRRKKSRGNIFLNLNKSSENRLMDRAEVSELVYNTLKDVAPEDIDGIKRVYADIEDDHLVVRQPSDDASVAEFYGFKPVAVADTMEPFPLIKTYEGAPQYSAKKNQHRTLIRQILSRIVDEA